MRTRTRGLGRLRTVAFILLLTLLASAVPSLHSTPPATAPVRAPDAALEASGAVQPMVVAPAVPAGLSTNCSTVWSHWAQLYGASGVPPAVGAADVGGCGGPDQASLSFLSNLSGSADHLQYNLTLPAAGGGLGSAEAMLSLQIWTSGLGCSVDGATQVDLQLLPPMSPYGAGPEANWTAQAPAYDLVPPATCDPYCSNDTALVTYDGSSFCEDNVAIPSSISAGTSGLAPGDELTIAFVGAPLDHAGLELYLNDTSRPSSDRSWSFGASDTTFGAALSPMFSTAAAGTDAWGTFEGAGVSWTNCPLPWEPASACDSYNSAIDEAVLPVAITSVGFVNAGLGPGYSGTYSTVVTNSSTLGCRAVSSPCGGFDSGAGTGDYPAWSLSALGTSAAWSYGGPSLGAATFGGAPAEFGPGSGTPFSPLEIGEPGVVVGGASVLITVPVVDGTGTQALTVFNDGCDLSSTASTQSSIASPAGGGSEFVSSWSASLPVGSFHGTYPIQVLVRSSDGSVNLSGAGDANVSNGGPVCAFPPPPTPALMGNVEPAADGYRVNWTDPDPWVVSFAVSVNLTTSTRNFTVTPSTDEVLIGQVSTLLNLGGAGLVGNVSVAAIDATGASSGRSVGQLAVPTNGPLNSTVSVSPLGIHVGADPSLQIAGVLSGGLPPYTYSVNWGDGSPPLPGATSGSLSLAPYPLGAFNGTARVGIAVTDAAGDAASFGPWLVAVWENPLGTFTQAAAGDGFAQLSWLAPRSPTAPVFNYTVYTTLNASLAWRLASAGPSTGTFGGITVQATNRTSLSIPVPDGTTIYAQLVARNLYGLGHLPGGLAILTARPAPFVVGAITNVAGGDAPFTDNFSALVTSGSNDTISFAVYSFGGNSSVDPTVGGSNGTYYLNATYTFPYPGTFVVVLHVVDIFLDIAITLTSVFVAPGAAPSLSAAILNSPSYNGTPVEFQASAQGGSGSYLFNWTFGDGGSATGTNPVHTFTAPGTYTVTVHVFDNVTSGTNLQSFPITIFSAPVVFISVAPGPNGSTSFDFHASVGGGSGHAQVVWSFGDGQVANGFNVTHDYRTIGTYTVNATASDPSGRASTTEYLLVVTTPLPSSGGASGLDVTGWIVGLVALLAAIVVVAVVLRDRSREPPPPMAEPVGGYSEEDGEVTLT